MEHKTCECPVDILKREMGLENGLESDDVVYKRELNNAGGTEVSVRRVFVLYGSYRIGWVHDADVQHCMLCRSDFGFFKRKHHCRACGSVICSTCSPFRAEVPFLDEREIDSGESRRASRVCNSCFEQKMNTSAPENVIGMRYDDVVVQNREKQENAQNGNMFATGEVEGFNSHETEAEAQPSRSAGDATQTKARASARASRKREKRAELEGVQFQLLEEPKYSKAYRRMRGMIPPFLASLNLASLQATGLPRSVAERIWTNRSLWLIVMHPEDIRKVHIADLRSKYTPVGLDLTERYAVWFNLPEWEADEGGRGSGAEDFRFLQNNSNSDKVEWKINFKVQMDEMARKHARGELADDLVRHSAYQGAEPLQLFSHRTPLAQVYSGSSNNSCCSGTSTARERRPRPPVEVPSPPCSPASSNGSSVLSPCSPDRRDWPGQAGSAEDNSPVVSLFVHRTGSTADDDDGSVVTSRATELQSQPHTSHSSASSPPRPSSPASASAGSLLPTLEQQKQKREDRIKERKRRAFRSSLSLAGRESVEARTAGNAFSRCSSRDEVDVLVSEGHELSLSRAGDSGDERRQLLHRVLSTPIEVVPGPSPPSSPPPSSLSSLPSLSTCPPENTAAAANCVTPSAAAGSSSLFGGHGDAETPAQVTGSDDGRTRRNSGNKNNSSSMSSVLLTSLIERDLPQLTATPLRDLMADNTRSQRRSVVEVMERMRAADICLEPREATELLKYAVVNLMDMREDGIEGGEGDAGEQEAAREEAEYENAMLSIIDILATECGADLDTLDRDGNNLLTFLQESVTPDMHMSTRLVPTLLRHGMSILVKHRRGGKESAMDIHPLFASLPMEQQKQLAAQFASAASLAQLSPSQQFTYFSLLVVLGRAVLASSLLDKESSVRGTLTHDVASALLKVCSFDSDSMEDPIETFELLDLHGAKF